ncbi:phosphoenolpyruvate synthase regulatory protein [Thalassospira xiamenensis]|nr:phosphoenolpyruvate synthase regulatory protein [Thalassospira xiamenensis]
MRTAFFVSDGTALTAEAFGNALLSMFPVKIKPVTLAFIDTEEKAVKARHRINQTAAENGGKPLIFHTFVNTKIKAIITASNAVSYDFLDHFVAPVAKELDCEAQPKTHRTHGIHNDYDFRIDAINYTLANDDGSNLSNYEEADIILVGVSRTGKTPTSLYLALQYGIKAANYPFTEDDHMEQLKLPRALQSFRHKLFGLTLDADRLHQIRSKRREGSVYASLSQCRFELQQVESLYRREAIPFIDSTRFSVEEIAAKILAETNLERHRF